MADSVERQEKIGRRLEGEIIDLKRGIVETEQNIDILKSELKEMTSIHRAAQRGEIAKSEPSRLEKALGAEPEDIDYTKYSTETMQDKRIQLRSDEQKLERMMTALGQKIRQLTRVDQALRGEKDE